MRPDRKETNMNRYLERTWFRNVLLLVALVTGGLLTQVIPTYEEMAALRERPATPSAASRAREHESSDVTNRSVKQRHRRTIYTVG